MATSTSSVTAGEIMDQAAVLMNDPAKTDYTYVVLTPLLRMALDELVDSQIDSQNPPLIQTSDPILVEVGKTSLHQAHQSIDPPWYPADLEEVQEIGERLAGSKDLFTPMKRTEFLGYLGPATDALRFWTWEYELIKFPASGASTPRELQLKYIRGFSGPPNLQPDAIVGGHNSRAFLSYKTAAFAAMFIGENPERASVLDDQATKALERLESISNKGRQQIMTRHRPFRASWKMRGGI